jgi:hypothetical protein
MIPNLLPLAVGWSILALVVIVLIVMRKRVASQEDDTLHVLDGDARLVGRQSAVAQKLLVIDRWGKILTVIAILYGIALACAFIYNNWIEASGLK